jgi:hypothetical protein
MFFCVSAFGSDVKITPKMYMENHEIPKGKRVILVTDINRVVDEQEAYIGKKIELSGYVNENDFNDFKDWGFILSDKSGKSITCYEFETREVNFIEQEIALRQAKERNELTMKAPNMGMRIKNIIRFRPSNNNA